MRLINRARCLAGVAIAALCASTASANVFPPVVIGGVYYQATNTISFAPPNDNGCSGVSACYAVFNRVPVGKQLIVTHASCRLMVTQGGNAGTVTASMLLAERTHDGFLPGEQQLQPVNTEGSNFIVTGTTLFPYAARQRPVIGIFAGALGTTMSGVCSIAGQISDAPP